MKRQGMMLAFDARMRAEASSEPGPKRRRSRRRRRSAVLGAGVAAIGVLVVVAPQLLGGALGWTVGVILALSVLTSGIVWFATRHEAARAAAPVAGIAMLLAFSWTVLQATPLPCSVVATIAPASAEHVAATERALGEGALACTLSRDPGATREEVAKGAAILAACCAAWLLAAVGRRRAILTAVGVSSATMAVVAIGHELVAAERVWGLYRPVAATDSHLFAPLMNENHLAGLLVLGTPLLIVLAIRATTPSARVAWLAAATVTAAAVMLTTSRGGIAALALSLGLVGVLIWRARRRTRLATWTTAAMGGALVLGIALGAWVASEPISQDIAHPDFRKIDLFADAAGFAADHAGIGVGRGAFASAFTEFAQTQKRATHAENLPLHWIAEWGAVVALALLFTLGIAVARACRRTSSLSRLAGISGLVALVAQNFVDFSLELGGVSVVAAVVLGAVLAPDQDRDATFVGEGWTSMRNWGAVVTVAAAIVLVVLGPRLESSSTPHLQAELIEHLRASDRAAFRARLRDAVALHPSEPSFALLAGAEAGRHDDPSALRWLSRAMALAPRWPGPHLEAARILLGLRRTDQALLELREAAHLSPPSATPLLCWILRRHATAETARRAAPSADGRAYVLDAAARCLPPDAPATAELDREIARLEPRNPAPRVREAQRLLRAGRPEDALGVARLAAAAAPASVEAHWVLADALVATGKPDQALAMLERAEGVVDAEGLARARARTHASMGNAEGVRRAIDDLRGLSGGSGPRLAATLDFASRLELQMGNENRAIASLEEAFRFDPQPMFLERVAGLSERMGDRRRAYRAYQRLAALAPDEPRYRAAMARVEGPPP